MAITYAELERLFASIQARGRALYVRAKLIEGHMRDLKRQGVEVAPPDLLLRKVQLDKDIAQHNRDMLRYWELYNQFWSRVEHANPLSDT